METAINNFADNVGRGRANTLETEAVDTGLLSYTGLDAAFDSSDIVLIVIDSETNEDTTTANNGGTAVYRFQNSNTDTSGYSFIFRVRVNWCVSGCGAWNCGFCLMINFD